MSTSKKKINNPPASVQNFPIVGIGASAGGLDAFKRLLKTIPENSGMAYVLVQHLDPSHESFLPEILQRSTKIPVHEITEDIHLAPNHIYIIPSNKILTSIDGVLQLTPREKNIINRAIDIFFTSLADVHKEFAVGIVLSGTGSDGTLGLKAIKENGGISIAQDIQSASYNSMPQSAVNAGVVDFILAPEKMPEQLLQIKRAYKKSHVFKEEEQLPKDDEEIFKQIILILRQRSGVDFSYYKRPTFHRRIARRIAIVNKNNLFEYLKFLRTNDAEQDALFQDVLIPVTSFFRDPKTFQNLHDTVFPALFKDKSNGEPIRIWIAGCSTGEEAFSIAISLYEFLGEKLVNKKIQIFASDISEKAIKKARVAKYSKAEVENISDTRLNNYFIKSNGNYEVRKLIRDMCVFAPQNFLKDPPFAKMDLISCRNVLIYMDTFLQKKALTTFHYALNEKGFLLLGNSETIGASSDLFSQFVINDKIYLRKNVPGRFIHVATERKEEALITKAKTLTKQETVHTDFRKGAEAIMISKSPASVVVNEQMDIVHIHGDITPFLQQPQGKPTHNLMKMAREGLAFELRNAIHKVKSSENSVIKEGIPIKLNGEQFLVTVTISPLTNIVDLHFLIQFEKKIVIVDEAEKKSSSQKNNTIQIRNEELEKELMQTREDMRCITEDMEAANEELQSANEELQSSNEEMQSLNEELETSREELQSTNEELIIVNQELLDKQEQLNAASYYAESIVSTIREPLIVLDKTLRIKTANASFYKVFNAEENEIEGKLFFEIQNHQWDDSVMRSLFEKILPKKEGLTDFEIILKFPLLGERTMLMNARQIVNEKTAEQLILLAIEDITERKIAEQKLEKTLIDLGQKNKLIEESEKRFSNILSQSLMSIAIFKGPEMVVTFANEPMLNVLGKGNAVLDRPLLEGIPELKDQIFPKLLADVYKTGVPFEGFETKATLLQNAIPVDIYFNFIYQPYRDVDDTITGVTVLATDVTEQVLAKKQVEESEKLFRELSASLEVKVNKRTAELQTSNKELKQSNIQLDQFAHITSHDLQEPLRKILTFSMRLQDKHKDELTSEVKSYLNKIESASERMQTLIQDLLNYSRLLHHEKLYIPNDLNKIVENILNDFELLIQEKKAKIKFGKLPTIEANPLQMNQLFYNLISNSLKYCKEDVTPVITITSRILTKKQVQKYPALNPLMTYTEIIFKDNGIGFEQQYAEKIFTIFQRLHAKGTFLGTGIGLAITKKIIENHHGEIFANAKENEGATFHVILPITQPQS